MGTPFRVASLLLAKSFNGRYPQALRRLESSISSPLGFKGHYPSSQANYESAPLRSNLVLKDTSYIHDKQPLIILPVTTTSTETSRTATSSQPSNATMSWSAVNLQSATSPLAPSGSCPSHLDTVSSTPQRKHKIPVGSCSNTHIDNLQNQKCLHSSMDGFFVYVLGVIFNGIPPALIYLGGVLLTISISAILFVISVISSP